ncbi:aminopeptidase P family protein [Buchananella hordeovulneris]|uniref:Xaa-Pro aminopeptidase n=1 Tax=Buchananella hordeovulneris TaxID=52770 RepID=A0A1Q5PVM9_9ACTO|nr:aminopeptidase P family protein [Buchananella hordeovulneris]OKL51641.1 Xaa-Pro aminopeptidase [Buchananella hordeovulneris]
MSNDTKRDPNKVTEKPGDARSQRPDSSAFREFIGSQWGPRPAGPTAANESAPYARRRREKVSALRPGERLVVPAGGLKVRNNDCDYRFRPHSAFSHLTGMGTDFLPDAVLVLEPQEQGHEAVLYFHPRASRSSEEFYADSRYGELWVGVRPSLEEVETLTGIRCAHITGLQDALAKDAGAVQLRIVPEADDAVAALVNQVRQAAGIELDAAVEQADAAFARELSELRLTKDAWEATQMRLAVDATARGFDDVLRQLPRAVSHPRGERVIEGAFGARAREDGNGCGYDTIAAAGNHANTLHWIANDGPVREGDMVLIDAGVEVDSLYTADITRTIPVSGKFSEPQRRIYQAVLDAADAAFAKASEPGVRFRDLHAAAMEVIAARLEEWGLLPCSAVETLAPEGQYHRRWMAHGTSHHLGIDVHDCALARREMYLDAELEPGMCFTIEPGLYFRADDLAVPEELRGQAVRIEDDIFIDPDGKPVNLSAAIPRTVADVEAWVQRLRAEGRQS